MEDDDEPSLVQASAQRKKDALTATYAFYEFLVQTSGLVTCQREHLKVVFLDWRSKKHWEHQRPNFSETVYFLVRLGFCERNEETITWGASSNRDLILWLKAHNLSSLYDVLRTVPLARLLCWTDEDIYEFDFKHKAVKYAMVERLKQAIVAHRRGGVDGLEPNGKQVGRLWFDHNAVLGRGSSGTIVFSGLVEGRSVAVKRLDKGLWSVAQKEILAFQQGRCDETKHVVSYFGKEEDDAFIYLALSKCSTTLAKCLRNQGDVVCQLENMEERLRVLYELALGIAHLHSRGIVHRDLTPSNVLLDSDGVVKLSDMGLARKIEKDHLTTVSQGTAGWQPVEVLKRASQTEKVDVFSLGCIVFFVLTLGQHPFGEEKEWVSGIEKDRPELSPLHRLQGVLHCRQHPNRRYGSKVAISAHVESTRHEIAPFVTLMQCLVCSQEFVRPAEKEAHDCDVAPHIMFAAEEMILRCLSPQPSLRPSIVHVLHHPLFWTCSKKMQFLQLVSDWLKADPALQTKFDAYPHEVYGVRGWQEFEGVKAFMLGNYDPTLFNLVRCVRNVAHHYLDQYRQFSSLKEVCDFFELYFPRLLIGVWEIVRVMPERNTIPDFAQFFVL